MQTISIDECFCEDISHCLLNERLHEAARGSALRSWTEIRCCVAGAQFGYVNPHDAEETLRFI